MNTRKSPTLLLVSGAPGSGKTRLSHILREEVGLYRVSKAEMARALKVTDSSNASNHATAWETYWTILGTLLDNGVSVIADQTTWRGLCDVIIRSRLMPKASVRIVHCATPCAEERWVRRLESLPDLGHAEVTALREKMSKRRSQFDPPLELDCPVLEVDTTEGYAPGIQRIIEFASVLSS